MIMMTMMRLCRVTTGREALMKVLFQTHIKVEKKNKDEEGGNTVHLSVKNNCKH